MMQEVGNHIALIEPLNEGRASNFSDNDFGGIASRLCLHVGALAFLQRFFFNLGLHNGSQGDVKEISYDEEKEYHRFRILLW